MSATPNMEIISNPGAARIASDAAFDPVDDVEIRVDLTGPWTSTNERHIANRYNTTGNNRQWQLMARRLDNVRRLTLSTAGNTGLFRFNFEWTGFDALGLADEERIQVRVRVDADDGAGDTAVEFSYRRGADIAALDDDTNWTVDQTVPRAGVQSWKNTTEPIVLGNRGQDLAAVHPGQYRRFIFWTDLTKTAKVADLDFTDPDNRVGGANDTWADAVSANNWEMQGVEGTDWAYNVDTFTSGSKVLQGSVVADTFDPANLVGVPDGTTSKLTWDASPTAGVADYSIFRRSPPTEVPFDPTSDTPIASGITLLEYDDEGLDPGDFEYQVFGRVPA